MTNFKNTVSLFVLLVSIATALADETVSFGTGGNQFEVDFVTIGNPGNRADTTGSPVPAGSVGYVYNIGKYEISRDMVTKANAEGGLGITMDAMDFVIGGARLNMPATGVSWNEAARFVNWLNTSQGFKPAYKFESQPGDADYRANANNQLWQLGDPGYDDANPFRNRLAHYFLPNVDEWYKAAYYDPNAAGDVGAYWDFPTGSDVAPTGVDGGTDAETAIYLQQGSQGPADVNNAGGLSPYGVMGMGGNVYEFEETEFDLENNDPSSLRGVRGGSYGFSDLSASQRAGVAPLNGIDDVGFRIASIPEPSTAMLGALGMFPLLGPLRRLIAS